MKSAILLKISGALGTAVFGLFAFVSGADAAPPVRLAIIPANGSGQEQEVVDRISDQLRDNGKIAISTVNPDWFVVCTIQDKSDLVGQTVRVNGTVTIKTTDGHVIDTVSVQTNKQDFNMSPGTASPINKVLSENATREVINGLSERAVPPINRAADTEIETRDNIINAQNFADADKYDDALNLLMAITPDTPHFKGARSLIAEFQMEQQAFDLVKAAQSNAKKGNIRQAIAQLRQVNPKSKRYPVAKSLIASLSGHSAPRLAKVKSTSSAAGGGSDEQLKALEAQKKALDAQKKAVDAQEAALKSKSKPLK
jgi:hypothetical protein